VDLHARCLRQSRAVLRTPSEALDLLRRDGVVTLTPSPGRRSLVGEIAGEVRGSWWGHPLGRLIFSIASALENSPEVLGAKLVRGRVAFVHRDLWPPLLRIVLDPEWRSAAAKRLTPSARQLLAEVERKGVLRLEGRSPARLALEKRGLLLSTSEHTEAGSHAIVLRSWRDWAPADARNAAKRLELERANADLRSAGITL